ncbi:hypothetical protein ES695_16860, partial [Candidatus Atribacteria bacterium 1244-E10-H5-B2]
MSGTAHKRAFTIFKWENEAYASSSYENLFNRNCNGYSQILKILDRVIMKEDIEMKRQKTPVVLTREEVEKLIEVGAGLEEFYKKRLKEEKLKGSQYLSYLKNSLFLAIRDQAIIRLLFSTGIRNSEACNLNGEDIYFEENRIKIRQGKRGNDEYQPLTKDETWKELRRYLRARRAFKYNRGNAFFIGKSGERVRPRALQRFIKHYGRLAGIKKEVYPHI